MGSQARDTHDNGFNRVTADFSVPDGCVGPPPLPEITVSAAVASASEVGPVNGRFTLFRDGDGDQPLVVNIVLSGSAGNGSDYVTIPGTVTIPGGTISVDIDVVPIDDAFQESEETVVLTVQSGSGYAVGSPSSDTVRIASEDVAPDFTVPALSAPQAGGPGFAIEISDTTLNQGVGASTQSTTSFYLSADYLLREEDPLIGSRVVPALAPGESNAALTTITLPLDLTPGTYRLFAKADGPSQVPEPNEFNNQRSVSIRIGPDLAVSALSVPGTAGAGGTVIVTETTKNQGASTAAASQTWFYLSANTRVDEGDVFLRTRPVRELNPDEIDIASTSLAIPPGTPSGSYYLLADADGAAGVTEAVETNNTRMAAIKIGPDLGVSALSLPSRAPSGGTIAVADTTRNSGGGNAGASTTAFYLSPDNKLDDGDVRLTVDRPVNALAGGATSTATTTVTLPAVAAGTWHVIAAADVGDTVAETFENNNTRSAAIGIGGDLDIVGWSAPLSATAGGTVTVTDTVRNVGMDPAPATITRVYLSTNLTLDAEDTPIGERPVPPLAPGASSAGSSTVTLPSGLSGRYYLIAAADGAGTMPESSETNNTGWKAITINPQ
jgi:subtilase family serine protease